MILYDYICKNCGYEWNDVKQSIRDKPKKKCPECGKHRLERVIYGGVYGFTKNVSTVGQLADKNTSDMGHYERSELEAEAKKKKNPLGISKHWTDQATATRSEINRMSETQRKNYIMKGKK